MLGLAAGQADAAREASLSLEAYVSQVRTFMPGEGSGTYVVPSVEDRTAFAAAARALARGDIATAELALGPYPDFEVLDFHDDAGPRYLVIAEKPPLSRGWGFYFFAQSPRRDELVLEAPHPLADRDSELAAARIVSALRPAAFLLAGAHRYADVRRLSDVAHASASIFESVHEVISSRGRIALQIHGFNAADHAGYPELVLSSGTTEPGSDALALCQDLQRRGIDCQPFTGAAYTDLGAQTNVQGGYVLRSFGAGHFLHFETAEIVRDEPARLEALTSALEARWGSWGCSSSAAPPAFPLGLLAAALWLRARRRPSTTRGALP